MDRKEWNARHKVRRTMLGAKWRFLDASESLGMRVCEYETQRQATDARALAFRIYQKLKAADLAKEAEVQKAALVGGVE